MIFKKFCLICSLVVISWVTLVVLLWLGYAIDKIVIAVLMGMSVGAVATKFDFGLAWKTGVVVLGLPIIWLLLNQKLWQAGVLLAGLILFTISFKLKANKKGEQTVDRFKDCC